jgi:hypothetical protein
VAPTLPPATANISYIPVSLGSFGIDAIQAIPHGIASAFSCGTFIFAFPYLHLLVFASLSNITFINSTPVTSGLFAWTLWYLDYL